MMIIHTCMRVYIYIQNYLYFLHTLLAVTIIFFGSPWLGLLPGPPQISPSTSGLRQPWKRRVLLSGIVILVLCN